MVPTANLPKYINNTRAKLFSFTHFKLDLVVNQIIYAKNAVEWIDMMVVRLSDGTYEIPAIIDTDAVRKAIGKPDLDTDGHLITMKRLTIKRSCLNICRKKESITPYIFVLDFTIGDDVQSPQGHVDICFHPDVRRWVGTFQKSESELCSNNYDTTDLEVRVKNLQGQEAMLEWILSKKTQEIEEDEDEDEKEVSTEQHLDAQGYAPLVPLNYDTFQDYQNDIDRVWDLMDGLPDIFCFPMHPREETIEEPNTDNQELEEDTAESVNEVDGQSIQEQLSIATVPSERNRLLRKLRVYHYTNNITCSLVQA